MPQITVGRRLRDIIGNQFGAEIVEQNLEKAIAHVRDQANSNPQTVFYDPLSMFMGREWLEKAHGTLNAQDLRNMTKNPIIGSIIQTRITQVATFCAPQTSAYEFGYRIKSDDPDASRDTATAGYIRDWLYTSGTNGYGELHLETFARKFMRDSLVLDSAAAEIVMARDGTPAYMVVADAATIKKTRAALNYAVPPDPSLAYYVQVIDDVITTQYRDEQMMFMTRNPQSDLRAYGYGMSELDLLTRTITTIINTERFNSGMLAQGGTNKGVLVVKGDADKYQMDNFRRDFREAVRNAAAFWRPPVLHVGKDADVNWLTLDRSNRDMEYGQLFDFLVKQACAIYQMDPAEINWTIGSTSARVNFESSTGPKIRASQLRGLKPLLVTLGNQLNLKVVNRLDPRYRIEFVGMLDDREADQKIRAGEVQNFKTVNEARVELGWKPIEGGDIILNQFYMQNVQNPMGLPPVTDTALVKDPTTGTLDGTVEIEEDTGNSPGD